MQAFVGDMLVVKGHHVGEPDRRAEVIEVVGEAGGPPYRVRWDESGHVTLFFPGIDADVVHLHSSP